MNVDLYVGFFGAAKAERLAVATAMQFYARTFGGFPDSWNVVEFEADNLLTPVEKEMPVPDTVSQGVFLDHWRGCGNNSGFGCGE